MGLKWSSVRIPIPWYEHKDDIVNGLVVAGAAAVTTAVVIAAAPAIAAAGVTATAVAGVMAVGATVGVGINVAVQHHDISTGKREHYNFAEIAINGITGAGAAVSGPVGAGVLAITNYAGTEYVNNRTPSVIGMGINGVLGFLGGKLANTAFERSTGIALRRGFTSVADRVSIIAGKVSIHQSFNAFAKAATAELTRKFLTAGIFKFQSMDFRVYRNGI